MFKARRDGDARHFQFLLLQGFSMLAFTSSVEPLRTANRLAGRTLYTWEMLTVDGGPAVASTGIHILPDGRMGASPHQPDAIAVCAGLGMEGFRNGAVTGWLRQAARKGISLGGLCTGALALARAGLLDGVRCTIHWENMEGFAEEFPRLEITATLFEVDGERFTCAGGAAALDMMIALIRSEHGESLGMKVAEALIHTGVRRPDDPQRLALRERTGISHPKVLAAIARMEAHLETPIPVDDLARDVGVSERQLERLFQKHLSVSPSRYYLNLRLWRARALLAQTSLTVLQVAVASGFTSASHFTKCYRAFFGQAPKRWRLAPDLVRPAPGVPPLPTAPVPAPGVIEEPLAVELDVLQETDPSGEASGTANLAADAPLSRAPTATEDPSAAAP
ncbi:GlxA family transcriptional regulator [Roseospira goensis]|uniref:Transcriptional regulator GlxA family with amidase domain n=1 Tax=Roseospira goensis TaxID=391922 RepID=A0A7W6WKF1_9PROT|nr:GlxA family transcriptional regulator [Roseospira goensis]MBB4286261.1 transcriptional regulator GlxA family with amidase domain [Roseospira goensis]